MVVSIHNLNRWIVGFDQCPNTTFLLRFCLKCPAKFVMQHESQVMVMKSTNRNILFTGAVVLLLLSNALNLKAQTTNTDSLDARVKVARQISWNIMRLVGGLSNHFSAFKGDSVSTVDNGVICYTVKGIKDMNADHDYIMKSPDGHTYYFAYITGDEARLQLYKIAFVMGIYTFDANKDRSLTAIKDANKSTDDKEVYSLDLKGTKVGSFSEDKKAKNAYLLIGFIK